MAPSTTISKTKGKHSLRRGLLGLIIVLVTIPVFYFSAFEKGYLQSEFELSKELQSSINNMQEWKLSDESPFKYRILFKELVLFGDNYLFSGSKLGFYYSYIMVSYLSFLATLIAFYYFLRINDFSLKLSSIGLALFLLSPVVLMAYKIPVHLREDYLAYFILLLGLIAIFKNNLLLLLVTFILGPLCRETLLILPFTYLFYTQNQHYLKRLLISSIPFIIIILIRFYMGMDEYDYFLGLRWNLNNPIQVIVFSTISFHFMWIILIVYFVKKKRLEINFNFLDRSVFPVMILVFATTFLGGIFNEIRLLFLVFPWVIVVVLRTIKYRNLLGLNISFSRLKIQLTIVSQLLLIIGLILVFSQKEFLMASAYEVPYTQWILVSFFYLDLMLFTTIYYIPLPKPIY